MYVYLSDRWTGEDALNFSRFRDALVNLLRTCQTPLTVGIFGPWGAGKTSLMRQLQAEVEGEPQVRTVWFTAWKYDREEALWRAFILRVLDALYPRQPGKRAWEERPRLVRDEMDESQQEVAAYLERLEESVYREVEWQEVGKLTVDLWKALGAGADALVDVMAALVPGGEVAKKVLRLLGADPEAREDLEALAGAVRREVRRYRLERMAFLEQFEHTFQQALKRALPDGRLIVFVDDLDRCLPEKAVQVLEAIKLFLEVPGTVFVLGVDKEVIVRGLEAHYGFLWRPGEAGEHTTVRPPVAGEDYLHKLVQIPFYLPPLTVQDVEEYVDRLVGAAPPGEGVDRLTRGVLARGVTPNPRQIKRVVNVFRLLRAIGRSQELAFEDPLLMKTVLIQAQWPELYREWRHRPTLIQTLERAYRERPTREEELVLGPPAEAEAQPQPARQGGLLAPYLQQRHRYERLERLLLYPPEPPPDVRAHFDGLSREEIGIYLRLAGRVESEEAAELPLEDVEVLLAELLSGDRARVEYALSELARREPGRDGLWHRHLRERLLAAMRDGERPATERARAGDALAALGDPRFDPEHWYLPREPLLGFVPVPAGEFLMGSDPQKDPEAYDEEQPQHRLHLPTYYIARWPVTVAQFRAFVEASRYKSRRSDSLQGMDNHPVVWVTWYDALAYARWLDERLRAVAKQKQKLTHARNKVEQMFWSGLASGRYRVMLPSEAEWEKAARGGLRVPRWPFDPQRPADFDPVNLMENPLPDRIYPWSDEPDPNRANYDETDIGATSAVGCFPGGASPYRVEEMSGNVWEWMRSLGGEYPYPESEGKRRKREDLKARADRVVRGGAFSDEQRLVRCAVRYGDDPVFRDRDLGFRVAVSPFAPEA